MTFDKRTQTQIVRRLGNVRGALDHLAMLLTELEVPESDIRGDNVELSAHNAAVEALRLAMEVAAANAAGHFARQRQSASGAARARRE